MGFKTAIVIALSAFTWSGAYALDAAQQQEMVAAHNRYRSGVGVPPLTWSPELAKTAQAHADQLKAAHSCSPMHSRAEGLGENLFWASAVNISDGTSEVQTITAARATDSWGSERAYYSSATNSCTAAKVCGHYTQIIWETTRRIGCGNAVCSDNSQVWVCNYSPAGNVTGEKPY